MTGRGIDQILAHPSAPEIHEPYVRDARDYVALAEEASGSIPRPVGPAYIWGDALDELARMAPHAGIINLETSITRSDDYWEGKGINYRMHPENVACLTAARIDICTLANNHVLDFGYEGLEETLTTLTAAGLRIAGAGRNIVEASDPAIVDLDEPRLPRRSSDELPRAKASLFVWSVGMASSGIPRVWAATPSRPGIDFLENLSDDTAGRLADRVARVKRPGDVGIVSIHWGSNWGYDVPSAHVRFAHRLIDGGVDLVHGHSSHHPRPLEVYRDKLVLYGCGDFLQDYEGITGHEEYRGDLVLMYFPALERTTGRLLTLSMIPMRVRKMKLNRTSPREAQWLHDRMNAAQASAQFESQLELTADGSLALHWQM